MTLPLIGAGPSTVSVDYVARYGATAAWEILTDLADSKAAHTLTNVNAATSGAAIAAGLGASAQLVAASTQLFTAADADDIGGSDVDMWISLWAYLDTIGADRGLIFKGTGSAATTMEFAVRYINATNRFRVDWGDAAGVATTSLTLSNSGAISATTPYHILFYHDAVNDLIGGIVNGGTANTGATSARVPTNTTGLFRIGAFNTTNANPCDGRISDVAVGKSPPLGIAALASEIAARVYNSGTGRPYPWL